jgi:hypothetical protein
MQSLLWCRDNQRCQTTLMDHPAHHRTSPSTHLAHDLMFVKLVCETWSELINVGNTLWDTWDLCLWVLETYVCQTCLMRWYLWDIWCWWYMCWFCDICDVNDIYYLFFGCNNKNKNKMGFLVTLSSVTLGKDVLCWCMENGPHAIWLRARLFRWNWIPF